MSASPLFSTSYLPSILFFKELVKYNDICIEIHENYQRQTLRNRTFIYGANGPLSLTVPVQKREKHHSPVKDIKIDYSTSWQRMHWKSIVSAYNSSPFFMYYDYLFEPFYKRKFIFLLDFNNAILEVILNKILKHEVKIKFTESYQQTNEIVNDLRYLCSGKSYNDIGEKKIEKYYQVFASKNGFISNLSVLDLLFNEGNSAMKYLNNDGIIVD